jgi:hypothetical protein
MDFLKRLFKREGDAGLEATKEPIKLDLKAAEEQVNERLAAKKDEVLKKSASSVKEILNQRVVAKRIIEQLKERDFEEDIKERTYKPILTSKPVYVRGMLEGLKGIKDKKSESFEELETFYRGVSKALKSIQAVQLKQGRYMRIAFEKEILKLGSTLNRIIDENKKIEDDVFVVRDLIQEVEGVIKNMEFLKERRKQREDEKDAAAKLKEEAHVLEEDLESTENELRNLEESKEFKEHLQMEEELEVLSSEQKNIENSIFALLSPLLRPFRKYEKYLEGGGFKGDKKLLEKLKEYQQSPREAFASEDPENIFLEEILSGLRETITKGNIALDKKEREKTLSRLDKLSGRLRGRLIELVESKERVKSLRGELSKSGIIKRREDLIKKRDSYRDKLEDIRRSGSRSPAQNTDVGRYKNEIEKGMSNIVGAPVIIELTELESKQD